MNCKQAQREIALWAGHDLDDPAQKESVRRHVTACPGCRTHYQQMKRTLAVLERAERPATYVSADSLWPELASRISHSQHGPSRLRNTNRFNGWMPFVAMTAACFILLLVVNEQPQQQTGTQLRGWSPYPVISEAPSYSESHSYDRYRSDAQSYDRYRQAPNDRPESIDKHPRFLENADDPDRLPPF